MIRNRVTRPLAILAATTLVLVSAVTLGPRFTIADTFTIPEGAVSAGHSHGLYVNLLELGDDVLKTGFARSSDVGAWGQGRNSGQLDLTALGLSVSDILGLDGVTLPLVTQPGGDPGLLTLGGLGALGAASESTSTIYSSSWSGVLTEDGDVNLDPNSYQDFESASLNLTALLSQLLGPAIAETVLDQGAIEIGAVGSRITADNGTVTPEYMVADLQAQLHSPRRLRRPGIAPNRGCGQSCFSRPCSPPGTCWHRSCGSPPTAKTRARSCRVHCSAPTCCPSSGSRGVCLPPNRSTVTTTSTCVRASPMRTARSPRPVG